MKYSFLSLIIGLILIAGAFLLIQKGNVSPFEVAKFQTLIDSSQIGENDYEVFDSAIDDLIKSGQIDDYLNTSSIVIFLITSSLGLLLLFFGIHTVLDKLFLKKFFEKPNYKVAIRRSILFTATIVGIAILRFYRLEWNSVVLIFPFVLIVELTIIYFFSSSKSEEIDMKEEQIDKESDVLLTKIEDEIMSSFDTKREETDVSETSTVAVNEETHRGDIREELILNSKRKSLEDDENELGEYENLDELDVEIEELAEDVEEGNLKKELKEKKEESIN